MLNPEELIAEGREEEAFEVVTGLHRCHIVHIRSEEDDELEGDNLAERIVELKGQQRTLPVLRAKHYGS